MYNPGLTKLRKMSWGYESRGCGQGKDGLSSGRGPGAAGSM